MVFDGACFMKKGERGFEHVLMVTTLENSTENCCGLWIQVLFIFSLHWWCETMKI